MYECEDCKARHFERHYMMDRRAHIKCPDCGSLWYEPVNRKAIAQITSAAKEAKARGHFKEGRS